MFFFAWADLLGHQRLTCLVLSEPVYKVHCSDEAMVVEMIKPHDVQAVYLEHLKNYPRRLISYGDE